MKSGKRKGMWTGTGLEAKRKFKATLSRKDNRHAHHRRYSTKGFRWMYFIESSTLASSCVYSAISPKRRMGYGKVKNSVQENMTTK